MRSGEVTGLKLSDIDWERDVLYLHRERDAETAGADVES